MASTLEKAFARFDTNNDGTLDETEFKAIMCSMGNDTMSPEQFGKLMAQIDTDGDGKINVAEFIAWLSDSKEEAAGGTCSAVNRGIEITEAIDKFAARLRLTLEKQEKFNLECQGEWASQYDIFIHWDNPKPETIRLLEFDKSIKAEIVACMPVYADHNAVKEMNDLKFDHKWAREHAGNAQKAL